MNIRAPQQALTRRGSVLLDSSSPEVDSVRSYSNSMRLTLHAPHPFEQHHTKRGSSLAASPL
jgi:hypothetical protein